MCQYRKDRRLNTHVVGQDNSSGNNVSSLKGNDMRKGKKYVWIEVVSNIKIKTLWNTQQPILVNYSTVRM